jgi:NAD(P)-dependent dehydrogenase (short-subunit alcohol dehydrogenase family)
MHKTALVTGGTGGLGAAVTARLLDDGRRVVVPWLVESELERVQRRDGLELVQADLFDPEAVRAAVVPAADDHNRWVKPAQIAAVIAHLRSADADATSGATVPVYGRA